SDLTPLKGMALGHLDLTRTRVASLAPLHGMPLKLLNLNGLGEVSELSALKGMPLEDLSLLGTSVSDLSPLKAMPLKRLRIAYRDEGGGLLRSLAGLEQINEKPAAEFWKGAAGE